VVRSDTSTRELPSLQVPHVPVLLLVLLVLVLVPVLVLLSEKVLVHVLNQ
jgi:hypothetical protein